MGQSSSVGSLLFTLCGLSACVSSPNRAQVGAGPAVAPTHSASTAASAPKAPWLKGQTHVHTNQSGDGHTPPEDVVSWYQRHGFGFIVFTDHNVVTRPRPSTRGEMLVFSGVELTWNARNCGPPESPCNLHVNSLFATEPPTDRSVTIRPNDELNRQSIYDAEIRLAAELGGVPQLNHPNYHWGADASLIARLAQSGVRLVEFSNASLGTQNEGDASHPSTEILWDRALSAGVDLWNIASDDAHHFDDAAERKAKGEEVYVGNRGWIMVRAARDRAAIQNAMLRGEFYASTGIELDDIVASDDSLDISITTQGARTTFIADPGVVVGTSTQSKARLLFSSVPGNASWVRAVIDDSQGHRAWVQPIRLSRAGGRITVSGPFSPRPAALPAAIAPAPTPPTTEERWDTQSEAVEGRGYGDVTMRVEREGNRFTMHYGEGYSMSCTRKGPICEGVWKGKTGGGWFTVTFAPDERSFSGRWGYDNDRTKSAKLTGQRR